MVSYNKNDPETIQALFGSIAQNYDRANTVLSFGMHKYWNNQLVNYAVKPSQPSTMLDLCCGTGEIAFTYLKQASQPCHVYLLDFCEEMLSCAQAKANKLNFSSSHTLAYLKADAQFIPLKDSSIDCATIAYGIRNVKDPAKCFQEVLRVLKPGGLFGILELTQPQNSFLRFGHQAYLRTLLPLLGWCVSSNQAAYEYLCNSIQTFTKPSELEHTLKQTGFPHTSRLSLFGGIATILIAKKNN